MGRRYIIGSGWYCEGRTFANGGRYSRTVEFHQNLWKPLLFKYAAPEAVVIVDSASPIPLPPDSREQIIRLTENFQESHQDPPKRLNGWMRSFLHGAHHAYCCECDFFYVEQDCLAVGPWVERTYQFSESIGFSKFLVGRTVHEYPQFKRRRQRWRRVPWDIQQSLIFVPHERIPELLFRIETINIPHSENQMSRCGALFDFLPFGAGRIRPIPTNEAAFYAQHLTDDEALAVAGYHGSESEIAMRVRADLESPERWHG